MKKKRILVTYRLFPEGFSEVPDDYELIHPTAKSFSKEELIQQIEFCDGLLSTFNITIDKDIIKAGKNLKIISNIGVGFNNIDIQFAKEKNIIVTNTPDPVIEPTAELAFALLSDLARRISECNRKLQYQESIHWGLLENLGIGLHNKQLGIIGMGRIGQAVARRAKVSGMKIAYYNRHKLPDSIEKEFGAEYLTLDELLASSDFLTLHTPLNDTTHHLINENTLQKTKKGVFIVNTARGPVMDEDAIVKFLDNGWIGGIGMDVFEKEPQIHPGLFKRDNVVIVPHIGTATIETRNEMCRYAVKNLLLFFEGKEVLSRIV